MVDTMTKSSRADKAARLERWADSVEPGELVCVDTALLRQIAKLAEEREALDDEVNEAVQAARRAHRSWSEIGTMLGVSKQAAQRKYGRRVASA
jgi:phosphomevalonate kinase